MTKQRQTQILIQRQEISEDDISQKTRIVQFSSYIGLNPYLAHIVNHALTCVRIKTVSDPEKPGRVTAIRILMMRICRGGRDLKEEDS